MLQTTMLQLDKLIKSGRKITSMHFLSSTWVYLVELNAVKFRENEKNIFYLAYISEFITFRNTPCALGLNVAIVTMAMTQLQKQNL